MKRLGMEKNELDSLCLSASATMKEAIVRLNDTAQKIVFVVDERERLLGTISDGDIRRALLKGLGFDQPVDSLMFRQFASLDHKTSDRAAAAKALMLERTLTHIPVLDENSRIVDVILWTEILDSNEEEKAKPKRDNPVVIMAGGKGSRLDIFTKLFPKPLLPIGDRPAVEVIMERFSRCGFDRFIFTLNYKKEYMKLYLKERSFPYEIEWVEEDEFLGTAGSLALLRDRISMPFFVVNCDTLLSIDFEEVLRWHEQYQAAMTLVGSHNEMNIPFGVLSMADGRLEGIREKPVHDMLINTGMYVMNPHVLSSIPANKPMDMNALINAIAKDQHVSVYPVYSKDWIDVGGWDGYNAGLKFLQE